MKISQEAVLDRQTILHIELEDGDLDRYLDQGYKRVVQRSNIPGFRKGKAPRRIVEQYFGRESLLNEVLDSMLPEVTSKAISQQDLDAIGLPKVELLTTDPFTIKATVPLTPDVDPGSYTDIRVPEITAEVSEEDTQQRLEELRQLSATWEPTERPAQMGDTVTMEVIGSIGKDTIIDNKDLVFLLDEDAASPFPGFTQNLVGIMKGEPREFNITMPDSYPDQRFSGEKANFSVTVKETKSKVLPELDDEFAKGAGGDHDSLEALRQEVRKGLELEAQAGAAKEYKEQVLTALVEGATIELAPLMVEHDVDHMEEERTRLLLRMNVRMDDYLRSVGKTSEEMREEIREEAVKRLKRTFTLSTVSDLQNIQATDQEIGDRLQSLIEASGEPNKGSSPSDEMKDSVRRMIIAEKTLDWLVTVAKDESTDQVVPKQGLAVEKTTNEEKGDAPDDKQA